MTAWRKEVVTLKTESYEFDGIDNETTQLS